MKSRLDVSWWWQQRWLWLFLIIGCAVRFFNLPESLYFTYDQGRDAYAIQRIVRGDLTLIGPTTGLEGFFTGPAWYYAGVPGYILGAGNPYIISAWYVALAALALPFYWLCAHRLFPKSETTAQICAYALALVPGSITASLMIWNPLLTLPLVAISLWLLIGKQADENWIGQVLAFFLLGLGLHAEFASIAFILAPLFLLKAWQWGRARWFTTMGAAVAVGLTLLPQFLFDLRHNWLLTNSLWKALSQPSIEPQPWLEHLPNRIGQMWQATAAILTGDSWASQSALAVLFIFFILGAAHIWCNRRTTEGRGWYLLLFLALVPYPLYLFWRGNHGYFWDHYLTSQFLFLVPVIVLGAQRSWASLRAMPTLRVALVAVGVGWSVLAGNHLWHRVVSPNNQAGLAVMDQAVQLALKTNGKNLLVGDSHRQELAVLVYTPNVYTDHYRYLLEWRARTMNLRVPLATRELNTQKWVTIIEPDYQIPERVQPWYYEATKMGKLNTSQKVGHLQVETWTTLDYRLQVW